MIFFLEIWCQRKLRQMKKKHHRAVFFCLEKGHFSALLIYCMPHHLDSNHDMSPVSAYYDVLTIYYYQPFRFDPVLDLLSEKNPVSCLNLSFTAASLSLIKVSRYVRVSVLKKKLEFISTLRLMLIPPTIFQGAICHI